MAADPRIDMKRALWILCLALLAAPALAARGPAARNLAAADEVVEVSIMELTQVEWKPGTKLPKKIADLDGKRVRIKGYMALETEEGTSAFRLTYDQCGCANAKASHFVEVKLDGDDTGYDPSEVTVEGVFSVGEVQEDGFVTSLYRLKTAALR